MYSHLTAEIASGRTADDMRHAARRQRHHELPVVGRRAFRLPLRRTIRPARTARA